jgi:hypothetical protein
VGSSIKAALDIEWSDPVKKASAVETLVEQLDRLEAWIRREFGAQAAESPLVEPLATLRQLREQDLDPEPPGGKPRIRRGTAEDRRVSVEDKDMRHGRKSKSKRFNGYKSHIANDLDTGLILACAITPANRPEAEAVPNLQADIARGYQRTEIGQLSIDRGYIKSPLVTEVLARHREVLCKPWVSRNGELFRKSDFTLNMRLRTITCPAARRSRLRSARSSNSTPPLATIARYERSAHPRCPAADALSPSPTMNNSSSVSEGSSLPRRDARASASASKSNTLSRTSRASRGVAPDTLDGEKTSSISGVMLPS